jgi:sugar lactone lactonase YvrE
MEQPSTQRQCDWDTLRLRFGYVWNLRVQRETQSACFVCLNSAAAVAVAEAITSFSLDVVGVVGEYAREWRLSQTLYLEKANKLEGTTDAIECIAVKGRLIYVTNCRMVLVYKSNGSFSHALRGFSGPCGITFDAQGNLFVADGTVRLVDTDGNMSKRPFNASPVSSVSGICAPHSSHAVNAENALNDLNTSDDSNGHVYVCEDDHVTVMDANGRALRSLRCDNEFKQPCRPWAVAVSEDRVFVTNRTERHINVFGRGDGNYMARWNMFGVRAVLLEGAGIAYDSKSRNVLVCDISNNRVQAYSADDGTFLGSVDLLYKPRDVCTAADGLAYVCGEDDTRSNVVSILTF